MASPGRDRRQREETNIMATFFPPEAVHCLHEDFEASVVRPRDGEGEPMRCARRLDELQQRRAMTSECNYHSRTMQKKGALLPLSRRRRCDARDLDDSRSTTRLTAAAFKGVSWLPPRTVRRNGHKIAVTIAAESAKCYIVPCVEKLSVLRLLFACRDKNAQQLCNSRSLYSACVKKGRRCHNHMHRSRPKLNLQSKTLAADLGV